MDTKPGKEAKVPTKDPASPAGDAENTAPRTPLSAGAAEAAGGTQAPETPAPQPSAPPGNQASKPATKPKPADPKKGGPAKGNGEEGEADPAGTAASEGLDSSPSGGAGASG